MKKIYIPNQHLRSEKRKGIIAILFFHFLFFVFPIALTSQVTYTFTNCGATGSVGPTQLQVNATYSTTNLNALVTSTINGMQTWTVPYTGNFRIEARGAQGGSGGLGATMTGDFGLIAGEVIRILVGQAGDAGGGGPDGGGGGSFVVRTPYTTTTSILVIAGGGSGAGNYGTAPGLTTTAGGTGGVAGGVNGTGGGGGTRGGGGGGFLTDGSPCTVNSNYASPGQAFVNGGKGGAPTNNCSFTAAGGFGGGSSHGGNCINNGGAGGGFSGGGGSSNTNSGGGGSFNAGTNQSNVSGNNTGNGRVIITELCSIGVYASGSNSLNPILCSGNSLTLTTNAVSGYSWSTGQTTSSIVVAPNTNTVYSVIGTSSMNCSTTGVINVTVSSGLPVLSVTTSTNTLCLGKTVTLTASGALTYTWTNGVINGAVYSPSVTNDYTVTGENGCGTSTAVISITVAPIQVSASSSPTLICASSPATLIAVAPALTYTWQPLGSQGATVVVNPSVSTIYTVTASDGTCSGTATLLLTADPIPTISVVASNSQVCEGYPVNMTATGGLSYTWMPGNLSGPSVTVYPTAPVLYTVVGSNSFGCVAGAPQILLTDPSPTLTIAANYTFVCPGTAVNITAGGGMTYIWSNGPTTPVVMVNPMVTTTYTVVGTGQSGSCTASRSITIAVFNPAFTTTGPSTVCSGSNATLIASGADSYVWDNGANVNLIVVSPSVNTTYTVSATTASNNLTCSATNTILVSVIPKPNVTAASSRTLICRFESSVLTAGGAVNYTWSTGGTSASISVSPSIAILFTYSVNGTDANGCRNIATTQVKVDPCNGINESAMQGVQLLVYPNPNKGEFTIESDSEITLSIMNELGQAVKTIHLSGANNYKAPVSDLANGIYFVTGQSNSGKVNQKIVVNK